MNLETRAEASSTAWRAARAKMLRTARRRLPMSPEGLCALFGGGTPADVGHKLPKWASEIKARRDTLRKA